MWLRPLKCLPLRCRARTCDGVSNPYITVINEGNDVRVASTYLSVQFATRGAARDNFGNCYLKKKDRQFKIFI